MTATGYRLVIGNKAWSSWSLRPWLVMKHFRLPFEEVGVRLRQPDSKARILAHSAAGKVPALQAGGLLVWDSLAIIEFLAGKGANLDAKDRQGNTPLKVAAGGIREADGADRVYDTTVNLLLKLGAQPLTQPR